MPAPEYGVRFAERREFLTSRLAELAPGRVQLLTGPRQVGKTTLLLELAERHRNAAIYAAMDGPEAAVPGFWKRLSVRADETATEPRNSSFRCQSFLHFNW